MPVTPDQIIRDEIRAVGAYHVPDSRGYVKLDAMENPYGLPVELAEEVGRLAAGAALNRYPDPSAAGLKARLREVMDVPAGMELLVGNGSDEIILMLALAVNRPGATLLAPEPSFVMFRMVASFVGLRYAGVPLAPDFSLDLPAMESAIRAHRPALIFLAYPNNPTGNLFDPAAIARIVELAPGLVVVDEAYHAFAGESFLPRLERYPNLLVMRTLSKLGLAGLRLGLLAGREEWLRELDKVRLPYNVNVLTQAVAQRVLERHGRAGCASRFDPRRARAAILALVRDSRRACLSEQSQLRIVPGPACRCSIRGSQGAWCPDQEPEWIAPHAGGVPARDGRHAAGERPVPRRSPGQPGAGGVSRRDEFTGLTGFLRIGRINP